MTMVLKISNNELNSNKLLKKYSITVLKTETDYTTVIINDNDYYQIRVNLGGDSLDNPNFKVLDYGSAGVVFKMGVGQVNKRFIGRRSDNYATKALDSLRGAIEEERFELINYSEAYVDFKYAPTDKVVDYLEKAGITCYAITKHRWGVRVNF